MSDESSLPFRWPNEHGRRQGLFNTAMGPLQRQLHSGEYNLLKFSPMFESDFVQVSKKGGAVDVHNQVQLVRVAIAATSPTLRIPNVLLLARPVLRSRERHLASHTRTHHSPRTRFELTRLLPLCFVKISIHDWEKQQLRFKLVSGRTFYLQLSPQQDVQEDIFESWVKVVHLLRPPAKPRHLLQEQPTEPEQGQEAPPQLDNQSEEPLGLVEQENPEVENTLQERTKEEDPVEPSQDPSQNQQNPEVTSSSTSPPSQGETNEATNEEKWSPLAEDQDPEEQLTETSEGRRQRRPKTTPFASSRNHAKQVVKRKGKKP
ncbi:protein FAM71B-like [Sphaerodactylus townsendi]|uniref:protein FAM71B-like n=1 Tax=Sphaerodactylus townsendi TaxID=933632 RepID=UPI002026CBED|nr:protein FAM71B-like [Sphaerodactylus townsendi]